MKLLLICQDSTGFAFSVSLTSVESIQLVRGGLLIKCFGNGPVLWKNVIGISTVEVQ